MYVVNKSMSWQHGNIRNCCKPYFLAITTTCRTRMQNYFPITGRLILRKQYKSKFNIRRKHKNIIIKTQFHNGINWWHILILLIFTELRRSDFLFNFWCHSNSLTLHSNFIRFHCVNETCIILNNTTCLVWRNVCIYVTSLSQLRTITKIDGEEINRRATVVSEIDFCFELSQTLRN